MEKEDQRNFILAMVLMLALVFAWQTFVIEPSAKKQREAQQQAQAEEALRAEAPQPDTVEIFETVDEALTTSERVAFDGASVDGSISLQGARIDDLNLKRHFSTVKREAELRLLRPYQHEAGYYASWNWEAQSDAGIRSIAGANTVWTLASDHELTTERPIQMFTEANGIRIDRTISLDDNYMFAFEDRVTNTGTSPRLVSAVGTVTRHGDYETYLNLAEPSGGRKTPLAHTGLVGVIGDKFTQRGYKPLSQGKEAIRVNPISESGGWIGFTDKYWMTALVPDQAAEFTGKFDRKSIDGRDQYEIRTVGGALTVAPGASVTVTNRVFAGAKELSVLRDYGKTLAIPRLDEAVDWGWLWFLTKPFFAVLLWLKSMTGSFGLAILAFVIGLKIILFPLYNKSYTSMAKMKKLTEPMKEIQERFAADPQRRQQEIMKLYRDEKANPIAGCLPILATIPIFFALYQTLIVTLEMRHEAFLYLPDLSQPDPTAIGNLFGLIPFWSAEAVKGIWGLGFIIGIGILPVFYGLTQVAVQTLNPPPADPMQRQIMMALPVVFMFVFANFASGLVLYWVWNNFLSFIQQYIIMRRNGVETELGKAVKKLFGQAKEAT